MQYLIGYNECHQKYKNKKVSYRKQIAFMSKISGQCKGLGQPCKISPHLVCLLTTQNFISGFHTVSVHERGPKNLGDAGDRPFKMGA